MNFFRKCLLMGLILGFTSSASHAKLLSLGHFENTSKTSLAQKLVDQMDSPEAREKVAALGIHPNEAKARVLALSNDEIREAVRSGNQAGGAAVVISLSTLLLIVLLVVLID